MFYIVTFSIRMVSFDVRGIRVWWHIGQVGQIVDFGHHLMNISDSMFWSTNGNDVFSYLIQE